MPEGKTDRAGIQPERPGHDKLITSLRDCDDAQDLGHVWSVLLQAGQKEAPQMVGYAALACGDHLLHEQRDAAAAPVNGRRLLRCRHCAEDLGDLLSHLTHRKRPQCDAQDRPPFEHVCERDELGLGQRTLVTIGRDESPTADVDLRHEVGERVPSCPIRPMEVLHDKHQRGPLSKMYDTRTERVEEVGSGRRLSYRARAVLVGSAHRPFKGDEETFDPARPDAALDFDGGDRLELPALSSMLVEHFLELVAGHLAAHHALAELDHRVLVAVRHATTIVRLTVAVSGRLLEPSASAGYSIQLGEGDASKTVESSPKTGEA